MEEDDEIRLCRLCGNNARMVIDVFGDEGVKRFLAYKIQTKLNILIDETEPLPKAICVQCLGKLEFVCDFQEECLRTQQLLRDQYNLPSLSDLEESKPEDSTPSTSRSSENHANSNKENFNNELIAEDISLALVDNSVVQESSLDNTIINNNNDSDKNLNSQKDGSQSREGSPNVKNLTKTHRSLRSQNIQGKITVRRDSQLLQNAKSRENVLENIQQPEITTTTRRLRSRLSTEKSESDVEVKKKTKSALITKKRLRSHNNTSDSSLDSTADSNVSESAGKRAREGDNSKIQIATNTLNKVLSAITHAPGVGVAVKEPSNRINNAEDISFTIELSKQQETDSVTVVAKVFPEQDSCLVDKSIVSFLEDGSNEDVSNFVNNIVSPDTKNQNRSLIDKLQDAEDVANISRNPEELFKMDGKEIHVDEHLEQVHVNNQVSYACKICQKVYERKDKCSVHVKTHLGIKQYMCILCRAKFVCKSDVMKHIRCSHTNPRPIACPKCPKRFRSKFDLTEHMNVHKGVKPYQCADCDQSYHHKVSLQMHVKSHMPPQNLACEYCGKVFPYRTRLLSHIGSVHMKDRRNFRCRFCYNLYSSLAVLNEHIKTRHTTTYTCETCNKTFKVAAKYKTHILQHTNPKPFVCHVCNKNYASKAFLNEHLLKHQGVRKHVCQACGAAFAQASHLAAHRHVHGEKSHACPECGKLFNRRDNMKVHRRRHFMSGGKQSNGICDMPDDEIDSDSNEM